MKNQARHVQIQVFLQICKPIQQVVANDSPPLMLDQHAINTDQEPATSDLGLLSCDPFDNCQIYGLNGKE